MKWAALFLATSAGAGYSPIAPGTAGSAVGLAVYLLTCHLAPGAQAGILLAVSLVGIWASDVAARHYQKEDPGYVVIDEVAGQLATLFLLGVNLWGGVVGFFVFRVLDIVKPWPARRFEDLPGGLGIMADDLMAGAYGWIIMWGLVRVLPALR